LIVLLLSFIKPNCPGRIAGGLLLLALATLGIGCNTTKYLAEDEVLLRDNTVKIRGDVRNKSLLTYELSTLTKQDANSKLLGFIPRERIYLRHRARGDSSRLRRAWRTAFGEPPVFYDDSLTRASVEAMQYYLRYQGYFNAAVYADDVIRNQKAQVTYNVVPGPLFTIDTVFFEGNDPRIDDILERGREESLLQPGEPIDLNLFEQEKRRLTTILRNEGYAFFFNTYFDDLEIDTNQAPKQGNLYIEVLPPPRQEEHRVYRIGSVSVYPDFEGIQESGEQIRDTLVNGVHFIYLQEEKASVRPQALLRNIALAPGEIFSQEDFDRTNRQLSELGVFRFVRIRQEIDSLNPEILHFAVQLTPNDRIEVGADAGFSFTNRSGVNNAQNLLGLNLSPTLRNRNTFGGAEQFIFDLNAGIEVNPFQSDSVRFINSLDIRTNFQFNLPRFWDPFRLYRRLYGLPVGKDRHLLNERFYNALQQQANSQIAFSYELFELLDFYRLDIVNFDFSYELNRSSTSRYQITHPGIDFLIPTTERNFQRIISENPFLERSFGRQAFVSLLFRDFSYSRTGRPNRRGESTYVGGRIETAGGEIWLANSIANWFSDRDVRWQALLGEETDFSQYIQFEFDFRYYRRFSANQNLATRFNPAIARPFGFTTDVPYVKQFFVGGANSMRAWAPRGLGPGGYQDPLADAGRDSIAQLYQAADLKLELNLEYRFNLFWRLRGALFLDIGNIWTINRDLDRCGSQFLFSRAVYPCGGNDAYIHEPFYRQLAIGSGFGMRVDLTYFIFRLDLGLPLRYNQERLRSDASSSYWYDFSSLSLGDVSYNLGLGYPF
jgi:outer membrane protein assembly factor BamA